MNTEKIKRAVELIDHDNVNHFGPMHITVEDGNMDDGNLDFVESEMKKEGASAEEWELLKLLREMEEIERDFVYFYAGRNYG